MAGMRAWSGLLAAGGAVVVCAVVWADGTAVAPSAEPAAVSATSAEPFTFPTSAASATPANSSVAASSNVPSGQPAADFSTPTPSARIVNDKTIAEAIARGVAYLRSVQNDDGSFTGMYSFGNPNGETALALLAMRYSGVGVTDPACEKGAKLLLEGPADKTYEASLIAQVLAMKPASTRTPADHKRMNQLAEFLTATQLDNGSWSYPLSRNIVIRNAPAYKPTGDNSNTQFAVLALWKLAEAGVEFDLKALRACETHFLETQNADGGWPYVSMRASAAGGKRAFSTSSSWRSMTATGLATLHIFTDLLHLHDEGAFSGVGAANCGRAGPIDLRIDAAMVKAEADLAEFLNPPATARAPAGLGMYDYYYLYSVERVGAASGKKHFGRIDWYAAVARLLLDKQNPDGSWGPSNNGTTFRTFLPAAKDQSPHKSAANAVETSLALLFLAKGHAPIFFEKLRYDGDWCNDRRDVAHVTDYAGHALERQFNWEVIDIKSDVAGWFDGPVLFFNGHDGPKLTDEEKKKLKDYVDRGGFLFAEACCGRPKFATAVRKLAQELWPGLECKKLPADHPLFTRQSHFDLKKARPLEGLTDATGFTFFILSPQDVSCLWNQNMITNYDSDFLMALNVYDYARRGRPISPRPGQ